MYTYGAKSDGGNLCPVVIDYFCARIEDVGYYLVILDNNKRKFLDKIGMLSDLMHVKMLRTARHVQIPKGLPIEYLYFPIFLDPFLPDDQLFILHFEYIIKELSIKSNLSLIQKIYCHLSSFMHHHFSDK